MIFIGTFVTVIGLMVAMDQYAKYKLDISHRRTMEILHAFRRA